MANFKIKSKFKPSGGQPKAISKLVEAIIAGKQDQVLLGVTGSGKTFTVANVIEKTQKPALVIAHNKTLAAQLTQEFREFFPDNAVEYFVSYYDYYQPEAYMPTTDTYIEKEATINEEIDRLRNSATQSILSRDDVIVVASVSCIYGLGSPEYYQANTIALRLGESILRTDLMRDLLDLQYTRSDVELARGTFRPRAETLEIMPANLEVIYQIIFAGDEISKINVLHKVNRNIIEKLDELTIFPAKHYIVPQNILGGALHGIEKELEERLEYFRKAGKILEAERLSRRTRYDLEMVREIGYCNGIENYSRYFERRNEGEPPFTLLDYFESRFGKDYMMIIDESHVTVPQIGGMYEGDKSRKNALIEYGFRLLSSRDNRPLKFREFERKMPQTIYTSATPAKYELGKVKNKTVEQIVRPTGLVDPEVEVRPTGGQIDSLVAEIEARVAKGERTLVTTLTKKMAEDLSGYLAEKHIRVKYLHSDVETLERIQILRQLREGKFDVLVGVNLLREGLDLPEVSLVAILDADKEGFLRSDVSLVQTIGRAARNINGKVILYADNITGSMRRALDETARRREIQLKYNKIHGITPKTIEKEIKSIVAEVKSQELDFVEKELSEVDLRSLIRQKEAEMKQAAEELRFEEAAIIRDQLIALKKSARFFRKVR
ncbi:MAG: excinuclease ABC subunit UvrB [Candidatus Berkelbacteria bacterium]|nr:excinuclease ABC subunit UvrB [Candidatus Berkelbacteria bacterium]